MNVEDEMKKNNIKKFNDKCTTFLNMLNEIMLINDGKKITTIVQFKDVKRAVLMQAEMDAIIEKYKDQIIKNFSKNANVMSLFKNEKKTNMPTLIKNICDDLDLEFTKRTTVHKVKNASTSFVEYSIIFSGDN